MSTICASISMMAVGICFETFHFKSVIDWRSFNCYPAGMNVNLIIYEFLMRKFL